MTNTTRLHPNMPQQPKIVKKKKHECNNKKKNWHQPKKVTTIHDRDNNSCKCQRHKSLKKPIHWKSKKKLTVDWKTNSIYIMRMMNSNRYHKWQIEITDFVETKFLICTMQISCSISSLPSPAYYFDSFIIFIATTHSSRYSIYH